MPNNQPWLDVDETIQKMLEETTFVDHLHVEALGGPISVIMDPWVLKHPLLSTNIETLVHIP